MDPDRLEEWSTAMHLVFGIPLFSLILLAGFLAWAVLG